MRNFPIVIFAFPLLPLAALAGTAELVKETAKLAAEDAQVPDRKEAK